ncbi:MAG: class I SAM-dependent methyltransferase [Solirubrobacteraceae bacterium]
MKDWREEERRLDAGAIAAGDATGWFEDLYAAAAAGRITMPFSRGEPNPLLERWTGGLVGDRRRAVVVGCGLAADAEHLAGLGFETTAFDISPSAIELARARHPGTRVHYLAADLLELPREWLRSFDLVVEIFTVQALPDRHAVGRSLTLDASSLPAGLCSSSPIATPPGRRPGPDCHGHCERRTSKRSRLTSRPFTTSSLSRSLRDPERPDGAPNFDAANPVDHPTDRGEP